MAKKSLQDFISNYRTTGLVFGSHFYVEIGDADDITNMYCESLNLPGISVATVELRIYGENREVPYMPIYPNLTLTFLVDGNMKVKEFFDKWMNQVIDQRTREVGFYNDYAKTMDIYVLDKTDKIIHKIKAREVYPKAVADIRFDSNNKEVIKLDVTFAMKYWEQEEVDTNGNVVAKVLPPKVFVRTGDLAGTITDQAASSDIPLGAFGSLKSAAASLGPDCLRSSKTLSALTTSTTLSGFGDTMSQIGQYASKVSTSINGIAEGLNDIAAPVVALSDNMVGLSNLMGTLNGVTSSLGLGTPFSGAQSLLTDAGGKLAAVSTMNGAPGALTSAGSALSAVGSSMTGIAPAIAKIGSGSTKVQAAVSSMGSAFSKSGDSFQEAASTLQTEIAEGKR